MQAMTFGEAVLEHNAAYADAARAPCRLCGGTHGVLDQLILPTGVPAAFQRPIRES